MRNWQGIAQSSDGSRLIAAEAGGNLWISIDGGTSWAATSAPSGLQWLAVASSSDGVHLAATVNGGLIYTSADSGGTWTASPVNSTQWISVTSSADGRRLAAADEQGGGGMSNGGYIWTSSDYGAHWTAQPSGAHEWNSLSGSADGLSLSASGYGGSYQVLVARALTSTTMAGGQFDTVTLQYAGGGMFSLIAQEGSVYVP